MSRLRAGFAAALAVAALLGSVIAAVPASASVTGQCDFSHTCLNFWGGGIDIKTYEGYASNNAVTIQWLGRGNGTFQLRDNVHGGCVGDLNGAQGDARAGGGNSCPLSGTVDWGTVFQALSDPTICGGAYLDYWSPHWEAYVGFSDGNGHQVFLDTTGTCLLQQSA
jgi:hypothetical protein